MQKTNNRSLWNRMLSFAAAFATAVSALSALPALPVLKAQAAGSVTLSSDGTLTLSGAVTKDQIRDYRSNWRVKRVVAADDCVLPADCSELFDGDLRFNDDGAGESYQAYWDNLTSIDLSKADTSHVTTMRSMFGSLTTLTALDISGFNTSNVTDMSCMFSCCEKLTAIDVSSFDTTKVTDMSEMFSMRGYHCNLTTLDLSSFDTSNVTTMYWMFYCLSVEAIYVSDTWTTDALTDQREIFFENYYLVGGNGTHYNDDYDPSCYTTYARIDKPGQPGYLTEKAVDTVTLSSDGTLTLSGRVTKDQIWKYRRDDAVIRVVAADDCVLPSDCSLLFCSDDYREDDQETGLEFWNYLQEIDLTAADTSNVTNMKCMFRDCDNLTTLDLSGFDTSHVTDMSCMFISCNELTALDISNFDTSNVTNMSSMFNCCEKLTTLGLSSFVTSKVTAMDYMFYHCEKLTKLNLSHFDTSNVTGMESMFNYCKNMTTLDLSSFDTSNVTNMGYMFDYCSSLTTIYVSDKWNTDAFKSIPTWYDDYDPDSGFEYFPDYDDDDDPDYGPDYDPDDSFLPMFVSCTALKGGNGTAFDSSKTGKKYARIDMPGQSGYLTGKNIALPDESVTLSKTVFPYTGTQVKVGSYLTVKFGDTKLNYGTDFTISYANNVNCGVNTASVTITGIGYYTGSVTKYFTIVPKKLAKPTLSLLSPKGIRAEWLQEDNAAGYQVEACKNSSFSKSDASYHTAYYNAARSSSEMSYPLPGEQWYIRVCAYIKDSAGVKYGIWSEPVSITVKGAVTDVILSKTEFAYTGKEVKCGSYITVKSGDTKLKFGTDFTMSYDENVKCGVNTASVTITGTGNYIGSVTKYFTIVPKKLAKPTLSLLSPKGIRAEWVQDANAAGYQVEACKNSSFSKSDPSYHTAYYSASRSAGSMSYPLPGEKWYIRVRAYIKDAANAKYGIWSDSASITAKGKVTDVTLSKTEFAYTGKQVKAGSYITVKSGDTKLKYGTDFTMSYAENVNCGVDTASVTITGTGNYTGTVTKYFSIVPAKQAKPKLSTKNGKLHVEWTADSNAQGYQVQYCKDPAFTGSTLHTASYSSSKTSCDLTKYPVAGEKWYVRVRACVQNDAGTKRGIWSEVSSLAVADIDNYTLTKNKFAYTGKEVKVGSYLTVRSGDTLLKYGTDFSLEYQNNVNVGTAIVRIIGLGEYDGCLQTCKFTIIGMRQTIDALQ